MNKEIYQQSEKYKKIHRESQKRYADKKRAYYKKKNKEHNLKNKLSGYAAEKQKKWNNKNKNKIISYNKINNNKIVQGGKCEWCNSKKNLNFHHTNYDINEGFVLCRICHLLLHRGIMVE